MSAHHAEQHRQCPVATVGAELLGGAEVKMPPAYAPFKPAQAVMPAVEQHTLILLPAV
jgi:hypothetical protein